MKLEKDTTLKIEISFCESGLTKERSLRYCEEGRIILMNNELLNDQNPLVTFSISCHKYSVAFSLLNLRGALFVKLLDISSKLLTQQTSLLMHSKKSTQNLIPSTTQNTGFR